MTIYDLLIEKFHRGHLRTSNQTVFVSGCSCFAWMHFNQLQIWIPDSLDYSIYGIAIIGCMYILNTNIRLGAGLLVLLNGIFLLPWNSQFLSLLALPLIILHNNGTLDLTKYTDNEFRMPLWRKYFFYIYYPLHLSILYFISQYYF